MVRPSTMILSRSNTLSLNKKTNAFVRTKTSRQGRIIKHEEEEEDFPSNVSNITRSVYGVGLHKVIDHHMKMYKL